MSVVDEVKERLDVLEIIGSYVPLKKAGRTYKGLCPFHTEKTPSFIVFPDTGTWHCFGACGTGGDIFTFIMRRENLDFGEALQLLARRAGVELKPISPQATEAEGHLALLREINQAAAGYYHHLLLHSDEAATARAYLQSRGIEPRTLERFQVGYALGQWDALLRYLTNKHYATADIAEAGLAVEREDASGYYDRFRGRIIFPIRDAQGRVAGFGGRILGEGQPKYLNSPQTPLFDKSRLLYGLDMARQGIRLAGEAVIVEGYMDVLMAHQKGINNVVAQMGTALTEPQLKSLQRLARRFVLALDADTAGDQATLRGLELARQVGEREVVPVPTPGGLMRFEERLAAEIRIASLPPGLDPDEVIRDSPVRWAQLIAEAKPVMDFYFQALTAGMDLGTAKGKADAVQVLGPLIAEMGDRVQRTHYLQRLARMVQVDERSLWDQIRQTGKAGSPPAAARPRGRRGVERGGEKGDAGITSGGGDGERRGRPGLEEHCLSTLLCHPRLLARVDEALGTAGVEPFGVEDLDRTEDRAILEAWQQWLAGDGVAEVKAGFYDTLDENLQARVDALVDASTSEPQVSDEERRKDIVEAVMRLRVRNLLRQIQGLRFLLEDDREGAADEPLVHGARIAELTAQLRRLQKAMMEGSMAERRQRTDAAVRVRHAEE